MTIADRYHQWDNTASRLRTRSPKLYVYLNTTRSLKFLSQKTYSLYPVCRYTHSPESQRIICYITTSNRQLRSYGDVLPANVGKLSRLSKLTKCSAHAQGGIYTMCSWNALQCSDVNDVCGGVWTVGHALL